MKKPFDDLNKTQIHKIYDLLGVHIYTYNKNQEILPTIKSDNIIGIILEGSATIKNIEFNGNEIIVEELYKDSIFGTNISATDTESYQIIAKQETKVVVIDYNKLINSKNIKYSYFNTFLNNMFIIINTKFREKNERIKVLEKKQIREKLLEYFEIEYKKTRLRTIYLPFTLRDLSDYLAVNRSAMFRELKNLKDEKFVEVNGRKITLLYKF